jgi:hypothetical protein
MDSLAISIWRWTALVRDLRRVSAGDRESGAFLLGRQGSSRVTRHVPYNSLDPHVADSGVIMFHGGCIAPLWEACCRENLCVLADVHTHPDDWTGQSPSDQACPMISQPRHLALIVPHYAARRLQGLRGVGIHEYLGNRRWKTWNWNSGRVRLVIL